MATGALVLYGSAIEKIAKGIIDLDSHTFKAKLLTSAYTPNASTHDEVADLTNECADGDYAEVTLASVTVTRTGTTVVFTSADLDWGAEVTLTAKYVAIYDDDVAGDPLIGYADLNDAGSASSTTGPFRVKPHATDGWFKYAPAA